MTFPALMDTVPDFIIKHCPKCGQAMHLRTEDVRVGEGGMTQYTYWNCACGHEQETGQTYLERFGQS